MISAYLWGYKNYEAGSKSIDTFRKFYPNNDVFIRIDTDGDFENYKKCDYANEWFETFEETTKINM